MGQLGYRMLYQQPGVVIDIDGREVGKVLILDGKWVVDRWEGPSLDHPAAFKSFSAFTKKRE